MVLRSAEPADLPVVADAWYAMLDESGLLVRPVDRHWRQLMVEDLTAGIESRLQAWFVVEEEGRIATTGGIHFRRTPATLALTGLSAILAGVYTFPAFRRRGYARAIVTHLLACCQAERCDAVRLRTTALGRPLYASFGFVPSDDMVLSLSSQRA